MKVFLSGGTHGDWQERVMLALKEEQVEFFDPRTLLDHPMRRIAETERHWLDLCDCLLFYFESSNPSGLGSAFEVGYCVARGKPAIYVDEKRTSHSEWLGYHCTVADTLEGGVASIRQLIRGR